MMVIGKFCECIPVYCLSKVASFVLQPVPALSIEFGMFHIFQLHVTACFCAFQPWLDSACYVSDCACETVQKLKKLTMQTNSGSCCKIPGQGYGLCWQHFPYTPPPPPLNLSLSFSFLPLDMDNPHQHWSRYPFCNFFAVPNLVFFSIYFL